MRRVAKDQPIARAAFEHALAEWAARAKSFDTIGDTSSRGQTPWVYVRSDGNLYYLNADSTKPAVDEYLRLLAADPQLSWTIVANRNGRLNKVAFGRDRTVIPGLYFYIQI